MRNELSLYPGAAVMRTTSILVLTIVAMCVASLDNHAVGQNPGSRKSTADYAAYKMFAASSGSD